VVILDRGPLLWLAAVLAGPLAPVLYSFVYYKKLERRGQLGDISGGFKYEVQHGIAIDEIPLRAF